MGLIIQIRRIVIMNKLMSAAIFSAGVLLLGTIAAAIDLVPEADAIKSKGKYLKDVGTWKKNRTPSKVCGDQLCSINDTSIGLRKGESSTRGLSR
jgi:hypothetical protein